jgi:hypothetical protein
LNSAFDVKICWSWEARVSSFNVPSKKSFTIFCNFSKITKFPFEFSVIAESNKPYQEDSKILPNIQNYH